MKIAIAAGVRLLDLPHALDVDVQDHVLAGAGAAAALPSARYRRDFRGPPPIPGIRPGRPSHGSPRALTKWYSRPSDSPARRGRVVCDTEK